MPATGKTVNYDLGLYQPLDTMAPLVTENGNMTKIDTVMKQIETAGETTAASLAQLNQTVTELQGDVMDITLPTWFRPTISNSPGCNNFNTSRFLLIPPSFLSFVSGVVSIPNSTKTVISNNTYINLFTFPEVFPIVPSSAVSIETSIELERIFTKMTKSDLTTSFIVSSILCYRNANITYVIVRMSNTQAQENENLEIYNKFTY